MLIRTKNKNQKKNDMYNIDTVFCFFLNLKIKYSKKYWYNFVQFN